MFYLDYFITLYLWILICALMWKVFLHYLFFKREVSQAGRCFIYFKLIVSFFLHLLLIMSSPLYVDISSYALHALLSNLKMEHPCIQGYTMHISLKQNTTEPTWYSYLSSRLCIASQESRWFSSTYIRKSILKQQAKLLVSCFKRLGFDLPLNPRNHT